MEENLKQLLLKDLCSRLPYGVKGTYCLTNEKGEVTCWGNTTETVINIDIVNSKIWTDDTMRGYYFDEFKPYLRPMSSMTEEEEVGFTLLCEEILSVGKNGDTCVLSVGQIDWLNEHYFDYRNLIGKGLALEAPDGMYKQ